MEEKKLKKIILSLILVMSLSVTAQVKADVDFDVIWENQPDEESDVTGDGFKDLVYSSDTLTETLIVLYCEGFESANLHSKLELYDDTVLKNTIYNTSLSTGLYWLVDIEELSTYDIDNIKVVFYDDYVDIWNIDGQDWASITQLKGVEDPYFVNSIEAMYVLDSTSYNSGFTSGYANALYDYTDEIMVDENDDGYDDDTFEDMYDDIYSVSIFRRFYGSK